MTSTTIKVEQTYEVPDKVVEDALLDDYLLANAISYWAYEWAVYRESRGFTVAWQDESYLKPGESHKRTLSYEEIVQAAAEVAFGTKDLDIHKSYREYVVRFFREVADPDEQYPGGDIDSDVADIIIQTAIFGKVIYG